MSHRDLWEQVDQTQLRRSSRLVGRSKEEKLRWLVKFMTTYWIKASATEVERVTKQVEAFAGISGSFFETPTARPSRHTIDETARIIRDGLRNYTQGISWYLPAMEIARSVIPGSDRPAYNGRWDYMFLLSAADLLDAVGCLLRTCAARGCDAVFVRNKRRIYCSTRCSDRERMRRFRRDTVRYKTKRRQYYLASLKRGEEPGKR